MKVDVIATVRARNWAKPGQRKSVTREEAKALVALKQAEYAEAGDAPVAGEYLRRDMVAQPRRRGRPPKSLVPAMTTTNQGDGEA